jgi:probable HAF family extracellular repeat protein
MTALRFDFPGSFLGFAFSAESHLRGARGLAKVERDSSPENASDKERNVKTQKLICLATMSVLAALALSIPLTAQYPPTPNHYRVIDLGTLGGTVSAGNAINNIGWVTGFSTEASGVQLATLWADGRQIPLGTLGGPGSDVAWPVKNNFGLISGVAENGKHDPLNETFSCPAFGLVSGNSCVAFVWQHGVMAQLPGLGGNNSIGAGDNDFGQVVGWAEKNVTDPTCAPPSPGATQFLQFEATLWQRNYRRNWQVRELPPYPGDPDGAATAINDFGQVVGITGQCDVAIGAYSAIHAVLWENGQPTDLGNLGGHGWNTPAAINNRGVVAGFANGPNDVINGQLQFRWQAFIWTKELRMQSIGTLPGDAMSQATDINDENQIVGVSYLDYVFDNPRAFIYQNGTITSLNSLIGSASASWDISSTGGINDRGEIAAQANIVSNGVVTAVAHAVLLVPCDPDDQEAYGDTQKITIPEDVQKQMRQQVNIGHLRLPVKTE